MKRKCIVHIPNKIELNRASGSQIRPIRMVEAFEKIGYDVDVIIGYGDERKKRIKEIKKEIINGEKYEFVYSESSTMPTLLTEKNHVPRYPLLDFSFFRFLKNNNIPIGLFYRDIYWKFPIYKKEVPLLKRMISIPMYHYDLLMYKKYVDVMYLPSVKMQEHVGLPFDYQELPPGCDICHCKIQEIENKEKIRLFYVGGVSGLYDLRKLLKVVRKLPFIELTICCREQEWNKAEIYYNEYLDEKVHIVHVSGNELEKLYKMADICMLFFESGGYRRFAMPIKLFEYLANLKPIIATSKSAAGEFVSKNKIGWAVDFDEDALYDLLVYIYENKNILEQLQNNLITVAEKNTWEMRAKKVAQNLARE